MCVQRMTPGSTVVFVSLEGGIRTQPDKIQAVYDWQPLDQCEGTPLIPRFVWFLPTFCCWLRSDSRTFNGFTLYFQCETCFMLNTEVVGCFLFGSQPR